MIFVETQVFTRRIGDYMDMKSMAACNSSLLRDLRQERSLAGPAEFAKFVELEADEASAAVFV